MASDLSSLGIDRLTLDERLVLVQEIWNTIADEQPPALLSASQRSELQRRLEDDRLNPDETVAWETVKAEVLSRLKKQ
jgi:putative addiction module component (TIGR02574 family)